MKKVLLSGLMALLTVGFTARVYAQENTPIPEATPTAIPCTDADKAALEQCKAACDAATPQCTSKPLMTLEQVRAALAAKCDCLSSKNYGQYESCVKKLLNTLREFNLIDKATRQAIAVDSKACRADLKKKKHPSHPNKGKK